uniref:Odorant receptor n=1 Tax=Sirex noctilio TaxID=36765 RepID=A0A857N918_9HYME|nr:odorant receptor 10 [Sirex noctilio]
MGSNEDDFDLNLDDNEISVERYTCHIIMLMQYSSIRKIDNTMPVLRWKNMATMGIIVTLMIFDFLLLASELINMKNAPNMEILVINIDGIWMHFTGFVKWSYYTWNMTKFMDNYDTLKKCHLLCKKVNKCDSGYTKFQTKMEKARLNCKIFMYSFIGFFCYGAVHWMMNPLFIQSYQSGVTNNVTSKIRQLPFHSQIPWNIDHLFGYSCAYTAQLIGEMGSVFGNCSMDVFYVGSLMIACAQLEYLNYSLADEENIEFVNRFLTRNIDLEKKLKECVIYHQAILKYLKSFEELISLPMFIHCIYTTGALCLISFQASIISETTDLASVIKLWSLVEYFLFTCYQCFCFCFYASYIATVGLQVANSAYYSSWELIMHNKHEKFNNIGRSEIRNVKCFMQMIIMRSQQPILLNAGPFYVLSLETFKALLGMAISYSIVLRRVNSIEN